MNDDDNNKICPDEDNNGEVCIHINILYRFQWPTSLS